MIYKWKRHEMENMVVRRVIELWSITFSSENFAQNRAMLLSYGSSGSKGLFFHVSSIYSRMTCDSAMGLPWCKSTGTFLWTGLYLSSNGLLFSKSSSISSYSTPLSFKAHSILMQFRLWEVPISFTSAILINLLNVKSKSMICNLFRVFI